MVPHSYSCLGHQPWRNLWFLFSHSSHPFHQQVLSSPLKVWQLLTIVRPPRPTFLCRPLRSPPEGPRSAVSCSVASAHHSEGPIFEKASELDCATHLLKAILWLPVTLRMQLIPLSWASWLCFCLSLCPRPLPVFLCSQKSGLPGSFSLSNLRVFALAVPSVSHFVSLRCHVTHFSPPHSELCSNVVPLYIYVYAFIYVYIHFYVHVLWYWSIFFEVDFSQVILVCKLNGQKEFVLLQTF